MLELTRGRGRPRAWQGEGIVSTLRWWMRMPESLGKPRLVLVCLVLLGLIAAGGWLPLAGAAEGPAPGSAKRLPRMYDGAPPQIPHAVPGLEGLCLGCHLEGVQGAPIVPHPDRPSCRQCHISQDPAVAPLVK